MKFSRFMAVAAIATLASARWAGAEQEIGSELRLGATLAAFAVQVASSDQGAQDADNTGRNVRDRDDAAKTPTDQGGSESDRNITAHIRKEIVSNDGLSTNAHNVKIITTDGIVTLRGPVKSPQEKAWVVAAAHRAPGVKRVEDQLEIERNQ
jgi:osmotically-inducible protein OsmY